MPNTEVYAMRSNRDGTMISVMKTMPDGPAKAVLQMAHGMAEHKERYAELCGYLAGRGYVTVMNDHRGHGASAARAEDLGFFGRDGARALVDDLRQITLSIRAEFPGLPVFLYGHSMGSLAVRAYRSLYEGDIDGLIVCGSPGENPAAGIGLSLAKGIALFRGERHRSALLANLTGGSLSARFASEGPYAWLSTDKAEVEKYEADPLCGFRFTANGYQALLGLMRMAYMPATAQKPDMPVHFLSGEDDPCMPDTKGFEAAVEAFRRDGYTRVTSAIYPGMRHEVHNERGREAVYRDLADVLDRFCG